jgi:hypothetical protein
VSVEKEVDGGTGMLLSLYWCLEFSANWLQKRSDHNYRWL